MLICYLYDGEYNLVNYFHKWSYSSQILQIFETFWRSSRFSRNRKMIFFNWATLRHGKKFSKIFLQLSETISDILHARLHKKAFWNSNCNTVFRAGFDFGPYMGTKIEFSSKYRVVVQVLKKHLAINSRELEEEWQYGSCIFKKNRKNFIWFTPWKIPYNHMSHSLDICSC